MTPPTVQQSLPPLEDRYGRIVRDLRIAVTDRCNYRCFYCKPVSGFGHRYRNGVMTYEEITRLASLFVRCGTNKLRLTGGEPLLRRDLDTLVGQLSALPGLQDIAMTTNAFLLPNMAQRLKDAGLHRLTISLDSLQPKRFHQITRHNSFNKVMEGIQAAEKAGFGPLKINMVVIKGVNDDEIVDFARFARDKRHIVRFIEFMPLDEDKRWSMGQVFSQDEILNQLRRLGPIETVGRSYSSETATTFRYTDGKGEIGIIASVTSAFCGQCSRMRLTADGKLRTCLFSQKDHDLLTPLRDRASDEEMVQLLRDIVWGKEKGHKINEQGFKPPDRSMSLIGG